MMKVLKNKKGITLVELIVGLLLLSIIVAAAGSTIAPMLKVYSKANEIAEWNTLLDNIANQMVSELTEMTEAVDIDALPGAGANNISFIAGWRTIEYTVEADGMLRKSINSAVPHLVLPADFYKRKSVSFSIREEVPERAYMLTVSIAPPAGETGETISRDYAVRPLVLNQD